MEIGWEYWARLSGEMIVSFLSKSNSIRISFRNISQSFRLYYIEKNLDRAKVTGNAGEGSDIHYSSNWNRDRILCRLYSYWTGIQKETSWLFLWRFRSSSLKSSRNLDSLIRDRNGSKLSCKCRVYPSWLWDLEIIIS